MNSSLVLTLIGMSGSEKTHWSKHLSDHGFLHLCCDDIVEEQLEPELVKYGYRGIQDVSQWLGQPYDIRYKKMRQDICKARQKRCTI